MLFFGQFLFNIVIFTLVDCVLFQIFFLSWFFILVYPLVIRFEGSYFEQFTLWVILSGSPVYASSFFNFLFSAYFMILMSYIAIHRTMGIFYLFITLNSNFKFLTNTVHEMTLVSTFGGVDIIEFSL